MNYFLETVETIERGVGFKHFDVTHIFWLVAFVVFTAVCTVIYRKLPENKRKVFRWIFAGLIIADEIFKMSMLFALDLYTPKYLPFHLCSINIFMITWHAIKPFKALDNYLYAIAIPAALLGLLFPTWVKLPIGNFMHIHSFTIHILLAAYPIIVTLGGDIKPEIKRLPQALLILLCLALPVLGINFWLDTNFMFLMSASPGNPLYFFEEQFGNHLIGIPVLLPIIMVIMYLPVLIVKFIKMGKENKGIRIAIIIIGSFLNIFFIWSLLLIIQIFKVEISIVITTIAFYYLIFWFIFILPALLIAFLFAYPTILYILGIKKKAKAPIIIATSIWGPIYLTIITLIVLFPHEYPYIDIWVSGKTSNQIIEKYGEPAYIENNTLYYRCNWRDNKGYNYYCIELDEDGRADTIYEDYYDKTWSYGKTYSEIEEKFGHGIPWTTDIYYDVPDMGDDYIIEYNDEGVVVNFSTGMFP